MRAITQELLDYYDSLPDNVEAGFIILLRRTVDKAIIFAGEKEKDLVPNTSDPWPFTHAFIEFFSHDITDRKVSYTRNLFNLVIDGNIMDFYQDLERGLNLVIDKWDIEPQHAHRSRYGIQPSGANSYGKVIF